MFESRLFKPRPQTQAEEDQGDLRHGRDQ